VRPDFLFGTPVVKGDSQCAVRRGSARGREAFNVVRVRLTKITEVRQLAEKHGLSPTQIRELIARVGNDREKLEEAAKELRAERS